MEELKKPREFHKIERRGKMDNKKEFVLLKEW